MVRIVFVHGTGVRGEQVDTYFRPMVCGVRKLLPAAVTVEFTTSNWGDVLGVPPGAGNRTIPRRDSSRGPASGPEAEFDDLDLEQVVWAALETDPLIEIRGAVDAAPSGPDLPPGYEAATPRAERWVEAVAADSQVGVLVEDAGLHPWLSSAAMTVASSKEFQEAVKGEIESAEDMFGRATVTEALHLADAHFGEPFPVTAAVRDALATAVASAVTETSRGRPRDAAMRLCGSVTAFGAQGLGRLGGHFRLPWTDRVTMQAGDIFTYLVRGERIRSSIKEIIAESSEPTVLVGHSLGGVASVDLLVQDPPVPVSHLLTVGSQATYLQDIDALPSLNRGKALPTGFPPWTNVYDPSDLLSFMAEPVHARGVRDQNISSGVAFPRAHRSYFVNDEFHRLLADIVLDVHR
ncbi:hypothetical protein GCM10027456_81880 [Kineosporia babensis]